MASNREIGRIGQKRWAGIFYEEFLPELRGRKGIEAFHEMSENDDMVGAILFSIEMLVKQADWSVEPGGSSGKDREAAEFVQSCMDDMQDTWIDTVSEILSFITYGWSFHEIVYKRRCGRTRDPRTRSKFTDGLIGWQKLPIRAQETLYQWEYDENDNLIGMTQQPPPSYGLITIPMEKVLLFRTKSRKDNPEGRSVLRNAYRAWYFKRRIQELEGVGIERDLAGLPVIYGPPDMDLWNHEDPKMSALYDSLKTIVRNIRRDQTEGVVLPDGFRLELVASSGSRQFDTNDTINRYDSRIAMTVMADFILLGHQQVGSFALSSDKTELFAMAIGAYLDIICQEFNNRAIPALIDINGDHFKGITDYPKLSHGDIEDRNIAEAAAYMKDMVSMGIIVPDDGLEDFARQIGHMPERIAEKRGEDETRRQLRTGNAPEDADGLPDADGAAVEEPPIPKADAAKSRLGRNGGG